MNLQEFLISSDATLAEALAKLEKNHKQFLAVVDAEASLFGTLTDGDLRRGLLKGLTLSSSIRDCANTTPVIAAESTTLIELDRKFKISKVHAIPVLNGLKVVDVVFLENLQSPAELGTKILIMAGGKGERLLPLTQETPKPLIPINGIPIIDRIITQFANQGFRNIWISLHHMSDQIMNHLGDGARFGVYINYVIESEPLGTAGAMTLIPFDENENILVCNADLFNNVNYRDMYFSHLNSGKAATIGVTRYETHIPYGVVNEINGTYESITEKPVLIHKVAAGVNIFNSSLIRLLPNKTKTNIPDFYDLIISSGEDIGTFELQGMWIDIGTIETLEKAKSTPTAD